MKNKALLILFVTFILSHCQLYTPFATAGESSIAKWFAQKRQTVDTNFQQNPIYSNWQAAKIFTGLCSVPLGKQTLLELPNVGLKPFLKGCINPKEISEPNLLKNCTTKIYPVHHSIFDVMSESNIKNTLQTIHLIEKENMQLNPRKNHNEFIQFAKNEQKIEELNKSLAKKHGDAWREKFIEYPLLDKVDELTYNLKNDSFFYNRALQRATSFFKINRNVFGITALITIAKNGWDKLTNPMKS